MKLLSENTISNKLTITRLFCMPNKWTFQMQPVAELLRLYGVGEGWVDPFAGSTSPAEYTNDLNQDRPAKYHLKALDFLKQMGERGLMFDGVLFDPPYSLTQLKECYAGIGTAITYQEATGFPTDEKNAAASLIKSGGVAICFGWDTNGFGRQRGFTMKAVLILHHGGRHQDTLITVERKDATQLELFDTTNSHKET